MCFIFVIFLYMVDIEIYGKKYFYVVLKNLEEYLVKKKSVVNLENVNFGEEQFMSVVDLEIVGYY